MATTDVIDHVHEDAGFQLSQVYKGFPAEAFDSKINELEFSPRELALHLTEAYVAGTKHVQGEKHSWGSYSGSGNQDEIVATMLSERQKFKDAAMAAGDEDHLKALMGYGAGHDYYHVGQLCTMRRAVDPDWDAESIYR